MDKMVRNGVRLMASLLACDLRDWPWQLTSTLSIFLSMADGTVREASVVVIPQV